MINQEIENSINIYDSIASLTPINQSKFQEIKSVLEQKVQALEDEGDLVVYGYYKYRIAERFLLHAEDRLKKKYENQRKTYTEQYNQYINLMKLDGQEDEEGKANKINRDENQLNQIKVEVQKIIQKCQKIDKTDKEQLQSFLNACYIQFPCPSINQFRHNNNSFKQLNEYLDELVASIKSRYNISDNNHGIDIDDNEGNDNCNDINNSELRLAMADCKLICHSKERIGESFDNINMQFYESIYQNPDFIKNYYGEPVLDEIEFKRKRNAILPVVSPDKCCTYFYAHMRQEQARNIMRRLQQEHNDYRDKIMKQINYSYQNVPLLKQMEQNEEEAQSHFKKANNLRKKKLQLDDRHLQSSIEKEIAIEINISIKYFRICMKQADKMEILQKSIIYRNNIALCYYIKDASVLAQVYALGALHAILQSEKHPQYQSLVEETNKVLSKIKGNSKKQGQRGEQQHQNQQYNENRIVTSALIPLDKKQCALYIQKQLGQLQIEPFNQIMKAHYSNCGDYDLQRYQRFEQAKITKTKKIMIQAEVVGATVASIGVITTEVLLTLVGISTFGLFSFALVQLAFIYPAYKTCQDVKKSYRQYTQLQETRANINSIIQESIKLHQKSQYLDFLNKLAAPYLIEGGNQHRLIEITEGDSGISIKYDDIIPMLLKNGFRPDAVGYLMILLGESILGCKEYTEKGADYQQQQKDIAEQVFQKIVEDKDMFNQAIQIDSKIAKIASNYKKRHMCSCGKLACRIGFNKCRGAVYVFEREKDNFCDSISSNLVVDASNSIAYSDVEGQCYSSYEERVKEIQDFASMNICLVRIVKTQFESAIRYLKAKLQKRQNFYYYFTETEESWYVLQDLIHIFDPNFQIQLSLPYQILSTVDCRIVNGLKTLVESKELYQATQHIRKYVTDEQFNRQENEQKVKQFYYWFTICFDELNDRNAVMFYSSKYGIKEGRNEEQEKKIEEIRTKYLNQ
ncbi:hypothetical protein ABPG72_011171 [Tetrahymena utriculariae]